MWHSSKYVYVDICQARLFMQCLYLLIERDPPATVFSDFFVSISISSRLEPVCGDASGEIFIFVNGSLLTLRVDWHLGLRTYHVSLELLPSIRLSCSIDDIADCNLLLKMGLGCSLH